MNARITLFPVAPVNPQYSRPISVPSMSLLQGGLAEWPNAFLSIEAMGQLRPVSIDGGWAARRLAIIVETSEEQYGRTVTTRAYGYTGEMVHADLEVIDPEVRVYFNRLITTVTGKWMTPAGEQSITHVKTDHHLLIKPEGQSFSLRAEDVLMRLSTQNMLHGMGMEEPFDLRASFSSPIKPSPVSREYPATYITDLTDALKASYSEHLSEGMDEDPDRVASDAGTRLFTSINASVEFVKALKERTEWIREGSISYKELVDVFGHNVNFFVDSVVAKPPTPVGHEGGVDSAIAALVTNAVSGIMGRHGVEQVYLESDIVKGDAILAEKKVFADGPEVEWEGDGDVEELPGFLDEVNIALAAIAKANGFDSVKVSIDIHLADIATVHVSVDGLETRQFVFPMYASARLSNVIAETDGELSDLVQFAGLIYSEIATPPFKSIELE